MGFKPESSICLCFYLLYHSMQDKTHRDEELPVREPLLEL